MNRPFPGICVHLGYYGPPVGEEPLAEMKPRLAGEAPAGETRHSAERPRGEHAAQRTSRVVIRCR